MHAREEFHKAGWPRTKARFAALPLLVALACAGGDEPPSADAGEPDRSMGASPPTVTEPRPPAGHAWVIFETDTVLAEVAATSEERADGLMYREEVPDGTGMLFVFPDVAVRGFWMANVYIALDIAFMDTSFNVVDIIQMEPLVRETYTSKAPAMYALEVRQGWLAEHGIAVGDRAEVFLDGGVRRGPDVLMALALGARAVLVGRPIMHGLALGGATGVAQVLEILREETENALALLGCRSPAEVTSAHVKPA